MWIYGRRSGGATLLAYRMVAEFKRVARQNPGRDPPRSRRHSLPRNTALFLGGRYRKTGGLHALSHSRSGWGCYLSSPDWWGDHGPETRRGKGTPACGNMGGG